MSKISEKFAVPDWVRWLAQNNDGTWRWYSVEPLRDDNGWYENEVDRYVRPGVDDAKECGDSLTKVE